MQSLASGIGSAAQEFQALDERKMKAEAEDALNAFNREKVDILFGQEGYYNQSGRNAVESFEGYNKRLDETMSKYGENLSPGAQQMFQRAANNVVVRDRQSMLRHNAKQQEVWEVGNLEAEADTSVNNAGAYYNQPEELRDEMTKGRMAVYEKMQRQGAGKDEINRAISLYDSSFTKNAIEGAVARDDLEGAMALYEKHGDSLVGDQAEVVTENIQALESKIKVQRYTAEIFSPDRSLEGMLEDVNKVPELYRDDVLRKITNYHSLAKRATAEQAENITNERAAEIEAGQKTVNDLTPSERKLIGAKGVDYLQRVEMEVNRGASTPTDWVRWHDLISMPTEELAQVKPYEHFNYLNKTERGKLERHVQAARKAVSGASRGGGGDMDYTMAVTRSTRTKEKLTELLGGKPDPDKESDRKFSNWFSTELNRRVQLEEEQTGKEVTPQRFDEILNDFSSKEIVKGQKWFGLGSEEMTISDMDTETRTALSALAQAEIGPDYTVEEMMQLYRVLAEDGNNDPEQIWNFLNTGMN
jgi:GNAT superfamily N-acetyltransferase